MRIGVVCEGPTDAHAIVCFLHASLTRRGITPDFIPIQPDTDNTRPPDGGWGAVLLWLKKNPPRSRTRTYFRGDLFDNDLSAKRCDVMVLQLDTDILSDLGFQNWTKEHCDYSVENLLDPVERGKEITAIIKRAGKFSMLSLADMRRHVPAPSVESTETWCIAAFRQLTLNPELLRGSELCQKFMTALHRFENRPIQNFVHIDKNPDRRRRYCENHSGGFSRLENQCYHYSNLVDTLVSINSIL